MDEGDMKQFMQYADSKGSYKHTADHADLPLAQGE